MRDTYKTDHVKKVQSIASIVHCKFIDSTEFTCNCTIKLAFETIVNANIKNVARIDMFNYVIDFNDGSVFSMIKANWVKRGFMAMHQDERA